MATMRLDKLLSSQGIASRSELKKILKTGAVMVNGISETKPERKIETECDSITYQGRPVIFEKYVYYILNKPAGVVSATMDSKEPTVIDLLKEEGYSDLFPVGRLDKDTEGFLLITNDGELAHNLLSPKKHVDKTYFARIDQKISEEDIQAFQLGIDIGEKELTLPAELAVSHEEEPVEVMVTIREGKFHQIKRMFEARGKKVLYLKRISMGNMSLPFDLKTGQYRKLTKHELDSIQKKTGFCDTEF